MTLAELSSDLVCPRCGTVLMADAGRYRCTSAKCGQSFDVIDDQPILVDFEQSILVQQEVEARAARSAIQRGDGGLRRRVVQTLLPMNDVAATKAKRFVELAQAMAERPKVLIVGGGSKGEGTARLYEESALQLISFDIYASELTQFVADAHQVPFADETVDAVWIQAVLEHVLDPGKVVSEIHRILKPGGIVYAETPFLQPVHEGPYDFTRFTESGHRWLFREFEEIDSGVVLGPAAQLLSSIEHVVRGTFRSVTAGVVTKMMLFWLRYLDRLIPQSYASDGASAVYFVGRKSDSAIGPKDMIAYYKGAYARR
jgi:ubiquinone/menaquinone biosynthesis C-methylase UbiE